MEQIVVKTEVQPNGDILLFYVDGKFYKLIARLLIWTTVKLMYNKEKKNIFHAVSGTVK